jgi:hypothetical protein
MTRATRTLGCASVRECPPSAWARPWAHESPRVSSGSIGAASCSASRSACASQPKAAGEASASDADTSCESGYRHRRLEATIYWANTHLGVCHQLPRLGQGAHPDGDSANILCRCRLRRRRPLTAPDRNRNRRKSSCSAKRSGLPAMSGGGGNRTRVRGRTGQNVYKRSPRFSFDRRPEADALPTV